MRAERRGLAKAAGLLAVAAVLGATTSGASAESSLCRELEERLASPPGSAQFEKYDRAVAEQSQELFRLEERAARAGCFSGFGRGNDACPEMLGTLERMERNLAALERRRDLLARRGATDRERGRILAALEANGCNNGDPRRPPPPIAAEESSEPFLEEEAFGAEEDWRADEGPLLTIGPNLAGTFRTLCVRTCDGYYFPISYSTTSDMFGRDQQACEAQCPGTEAQLYFHRVPGEESEQMVSMSGVPYTDLPNAFKYRQANFTRPEGCGCKPAAKNFSVMAGEPPKDEKKTEQPLKKEAGSIVPAPTPRPGTAGNLEETAAVEAKEKTKPAGSVSDPVKRSSDSSGEGTADGVAPEVKDGGDRKVRVVGPAFLPDQEEAIDLRSPGRTEVR